MMPVSKTVLEMAKTVSYHLEIIQKCFKNGKATLIVRNPDLIDGDVVMSNDDLDKVIEVIQKMKNRPATISPPEGDRA